MANTDKSGWWEFFTRKLGSIAICNKCSREIDQGPGKSTTPLRSHLKQFHAELLKERNLAVEKKAEKRKQSLVE
uniref:BED-type domain-containing protein n=1 Tax=Ditylenchus dipsaci TaxID=166011 RepID=A0A915ELJ0_9BILA